MPLHPKLKKFDLIYSTAQFFERLIDINEQM